ncbi:MAG: ftsQ [Chlamydiales bacterium]|jgi:hypothetical protein|nr:ftsQ [Chlamydiales bacterium]
MKPKMPLGQSLLFIFLSTLLISGSAHLAWSYYLYLQKERSQDSKYAVQYIVQDCRRGEALNTLYLAELLQLSQDEPTNLYALKAESAVRKLLKSPLIKQAKVRKIYPNALYIEYAARSPIAFLGDLENTALDEEGFIFPLIPFFSPKRLPQIFLGLKTVPPLDNSISVRGPALNLAYDLLHELSLIGIAPFKIKVIDVSKAFADELAAQEVVICFDEALENRETAQHFMRLSPNSYLQQLAHFKALREKLLQGKTAQGIAPGQPLLIDLRFKQTAFLKNITPSSSAPAIR